MLAPGAPGISPTWTTSAKDLVSTSLGSSRVWFSVGYGILNEVFWPNCSAPQIRDLGFIVAGKSGWWEVKRQHAYSLETPAPDIPLPLIVHEHEKYRLELEFLVDPLRDAVLIRYSLDGDDLRLYALLAPHLEGSGRANSAWTSSDALMARKRRSALALMADGGLSRSSAGYVGVSDGWQDFHQNGAMTWQYRSASQGNVALMTELNETEGVLALAFAESPDGAHTLASSALASGFSLAKRRFIRGWRRWRRNLDTSDAPRQLVESVQRAAMVLKVHGDRTYPGAVVASLSTPWGSSRDDTGGYHLVWPRDAVEAGFAFLACGQHQEARAMLAYLISIQQPDGHWLQNNFGDGRPFWTGIQLDEVALPVLLAAKLDEMHALNDMHDQVHRMTGAALRFLAQTGPFSPQDRWEENAGVNPFTLGTTIAALITGAAHGFVKEEDAAYALSLADDWNRRLEGWVYVSDTDLDHRHGTEGHYVRITPPCETAERGRVMLKNRGGESMHTHDLLGMEFLTLVRLGLRSASDQRIRDTVKLVDALLRVETPTGAFYHRYNEDGYGEHADGRPFDGSGIGRAWPLLSGERGHYAVDAGEDALPYLDAMLGSASPGGMIPEQVWDTEPLPARYLTAGRPTGSAMPLVWAHAEFLKLALAIKRGAPAERLQAVIEHCDGSKSSASVVHWRDDSPCGDVPQGMTLSVEATEPFMLHIGHDNWQDATDLESVPAGLGMHAVSVPSQMSGGARVLNFTRRFSDPRGWENRDWDVSVAGSEA